MGGGIASGAAIPCPGGAARRGRASWPLRPARSQGRMAARGRLALAGAFAMLASACPAIAASNKVRVTALSDIAFGTVANLGADAVRSENVCLYADTPTNGYNVTAVGSGAGGSFQLSSGTQTLAFDVAWSSAAGQSSGNLLSPNVPLAGQVSGAAQQTCNNGPATSASLIVILRASALASAAAGTYNGTLTLVVGPE